MVVELNHTIVGAVDAETSARWFAELFGLPTPRRFGHFWQVDLANGVALDFASTHGDPITPQHYAFLVSEADFDAIHARLLARDQPIWADPGQQFPGQINTHDGGRGMYFLSNDDHFLEAITRPYGWTPESGRTLPT